MVCKGEPQDLERPLQAPPQSPFSSETLVPSLLLGFALLPRPKGSRVQSLGLKTPSLKLLPFENVSARSLLVLAFWSTAAGLGMLHALRCLSTVASFPPLTSASRFGMLVRLSESRL